MIQNPTKTIKIDKSIDEIKSIIKKLSIFTKSKLIRQDEILNEYEFDFSTLMVGNIITLSLNEINENKTEIKLEARRFMGAYDEAIEVTTANMDLKSISESISTLIKDPNAVPQKGCAAPATVILLLIISSITLLFV